MNEAVFKTTVMGGFNKSDVLAFIDKQDAQFKEREKDLAARIDSLSTGLKNETQHGAQLEERIAQLEKLLESEKEKCAALLRGSQETNVEAAKTRLGFEEELKNRDAQIGDLKAEVDSLSSRADEAAQRQVQAEAHAKELEDKLNLIDKTKDQIGRAMLEAQQTADKIVTSAKDEAGRIVQKAREDARNLTAQANEQVEKTHAQAQEKLDTLLASVDDYQRRVTEARARAAEFFGTVDSLFDTMQQNAGDILGEFAGVFLPAEEQTPPEAQEQLPEKTAREAAANAANAANFNFSGSATFSDSENG